MIEIGIDIGGTFTDVVCLHNRRHVNVVKVRNSDDLLGSVLEGVDRVLRAGGTHGSKSVNISYRHGTTVATNAVLEGRGAVTALLTTEGFEDILEIGRQKRSRMYDIAMPAETPSFVSPRRMRAGIKERISASGEILVPLDEEQVIETVKGLVSRFGITSVAVCYLHAYREGAHERRTRDLIKQHFPDLAVSLSCEVNPVFREYERTCVTAFDAYVRPIVESYLTRLAATLREAGAEGELQIMQSRGGVASVSMAVSRPVNMLMSGPAAGVVGAKLVGEQLGQGDLITMDIGGTTCDVSLIRDGAVQLTREGRLRGFPLRVPTTDITSIGAGGGSIAWLDDAGGLHVGPRSAGASPGPACYGLGGEHATATDASVALGYLNPHYFAGGTMSLDPDLARGALATIAKRLNLSVDDTALGIHRILNARMADVVRLITVKRGYDPRRFALIAFGGAGPVHASAIAKLLGIRTVIVPQSPGTLAAFGLLVADLEYDSVHAIFLEQEAADPATLEKAFRRLETDGIERLRAEGIEPAETRVRRSIDMRYVGQSFELEVPFSNAATIAAVAKCISAFHARHDEVFGHSDPNRSVEFVNIRVVQYRQPPRPELAAPHGYNPPVEQTPEQRSVCFEGVGRVLAPILRREQVPANGGVIGPCIIEQADTTTVVQPGQNIRADALGNLILDAA